MGDARSVVVIGGGMSGLSAAMAAAIAGAQVTVLEAGRDVGGSMALSGGLVWAPRDLATARRYIPKGDRRLQEVLIAGIASTWAWLDGLGLPLGPETDCLKDDMGRGRMMGLGESGARGPFAARMATVVEQYGGTVLTDARVNELRREADRWQVEASVGEESRVWSADAVVVASGGFQNNPELLRRFVTTSPEAMVVRSNRVSDGAGLRLLEPHGAALSNGMSSFYGHSLPLLREGALAPADFIPASQYYSDYVVALNQLGLRFTDESLGVLDEHNAQVGARQPESRYYLVFDEGIRRRHVATSAGLPGVLGSQVEDRLAFVEARGGTVYRAESLQALAECLGREGVPPENVVDTITHYNASEDPVGALFPPRQRDHEPLVEPPFYAVACVAAVTYTMGGLAVDRSMRVHARGGEILPGVFAAGADAGGVFQDVYGGGLAWAAVSGRRAGEEAAR